MTQDIHTTDFDPDAFQYEYRSKRRNPQADDRIVAFMPEGCERALDAACGSGRLSVQMAGGARSVFGPDLSTTMLTLARRRQASEPAPHLRWVQGSLQSLPFEAHSVDFVASINALQLVNPENSVPELKRVLKPGGRLVLCNWTTDSSRSASRLQLIRTLRMAYAVFLANGPRNAYKFMAERKQRWRKARENWYVPLTPVAFRELTERLLPGSVLQQMRKTMLAFWQNS